MLENQLEHSGILLELLGVENAAVTDSTGRFTFYDVADGQWTLIARYPYFAPCTLNVELVGGILRDPVDVTLPQLMKFWVDPDTVVVSLSEINDPYIVLDIYGYARNVGGRVVTIGGGFDPSRLIAVRQPVNETADDCLDLYGKLLSGTMPRTFVHQFEPGDTGRYKLLAGLPKSCFPEGTYLIYWALSDEYTYPKWLRFGADYNESLYGKREVFIPGHLIVKA